MKFSIQPPPGGSAHDQWADAMKAVCRLPLGIPADFRRKVREGRGGEGGEREKTKILKNHLLGNTKEEKERNNIA